MHKCHVYYVMKCKLSKSFAKVIRNNERKNFLRINPVSFVASGIYATNFID